MRQADALRARLRTKGRATSGLVGMRNWAPYVADAMRELADGGARRVLGFMMAAHRSEASWERYQRYGRRRRCAAIGQRCAAVDYPEPVA